VTLITTAVLSQENRTMQHVFA